VLGHSGDFVEKGWVESLQEFMFSELIRTSRGLLVRDGNPQQVPYGT